MVNIHSQKGTLCMTAAGGFLMTSRNWGIKDFALVPSTLRAWESILA